MLDSDPLGILFRREEPTGMSKKLQLLLTHDLCLDREDSIVYVSIYFTVRKTVHVSFIRGVKYTLLSLLKHLRT